MKRILIVGAALAVVVVPSAWAQDGGAEALQMLTRPDEIARQLQGDYGAIVKERLPAGRIDHAWSQAEPGAAARVVDVRETPEIKVRVRVDAHTTMVAPEPLTVVRSGNGEIIKPEIDEAAPHVVYLWPQMAGRDTSITLIGESGAVYLVYAQVVDVGTDSVPDGLVRVVAGAPVSVHRNPGMMVSAAFGGDGKAAGLATSGEGGQEDAERPKTPEWLESTEFNPYGLTMQFEMTGDETIMPRQVVSDGRFTWLYYGPEIDERPLPTVAQVKDGLDVPVHFERRGWVIEVKAPVGEGLTLQDNAKTACIKATGGFERGGGRAS